MSIAYRNIFDATAPDESANVGAFLRDAAGNLLTSTDVGGKQSLDVNVANTITTSSSSNFAEDSAHVSGNDGTHILAVRNDTEGSLVSADGDYASLQLDSSGRLRTLANIANTVTVTATDLDIRDLDSASDSVSAVQSGTWNIGTVTSITNDVNIADGGNSITVDAVDLDIRDLAFATDSVTAHQGGTWTIDAITNDVSIDDGGNSITVDATDLDIRDLSASQDNVAISDGTDTLAINTDGSIQAHDIANSAAVASASSVTTTSAALLGSEQSNRKYLLMANNGNKIVYIGPSGVSTSSGFPLAPGGYAELRVGAAIALHAVAQSGTQDVRVLQLA